MESRFRSSRDRDRILRRDTISDCGVGPQLEQSVQSERSEILTAVRYCGMCHCVFRLKCTTFVERTASSRFKFSSLNIKTAGFYTISKWKHTVTYKTRVTGKFQDTWQLLRFLWRLADRASQYIYRFADCASAENFFNSWATFSLRRRNVLWVRLWTLESTLGNSPPFQSLYLHRAAETLVIFGGVSMLSMVFQLMIPIFEIKRKPEFAFRGINLSDI